MQQRPAAGRPCRRPRVLLVERHDESRELLAAFLAEEGVEVVAAVADLGDAPAAIAQVDPDVAVVDQCHTDHEDPERSRRLRTMAARVPLLVHYGYLDTACGEELAAAGATALVPKTVRGRPLLAAITEVAPRP